MKICHMAYQTWPSICGSVSRTNQIILANQMANLDVSVISGPFQPSQNPNLTIEIHKGIMYYRTGRKAIKGFSNAMGFLDYLKKIFAIFKFLKESLHIVEQVRPDILHCHATFWMGFCGLYIRLLLR